MKEFTRRAHQAIVLACVEAESMRNAYLGTEHLLLGLLGVRCTASDILVDLGADLDRLEAKVVELIGERTLPLPEDREIDMNSLSSALDRATPRLDQAFDQGRLAAANLQCEKVGTEHLLLGLLRDSGSVAAEAVHCLNLEDDAIRKRVENHD